MNIDAITPKLQKARDYLTKHAVIIFILFTVGVFGFMVVRIYTLSSAEPTDEQIDEKLSSYKPVRLDKTVVDLFRSLDDRDISIESLFDNGRTNPFQ